MWDGGTPGLTKGLGQFVGPTFQRSSPMNTQGCLNGRMAHLCLDDIGRYLSGDRSLKGGADEDTALEIQPFTCSYKAW